MNQTATSDTQEQVLLNDSPFFVSLGRLKYRDETYAVSNIFSFKIQSGQRFYFSSWPLWNILVVAGLMLTVGHFQMWNGFGAFLLMIAVLFGYMGVISCLHPKRRLVLILKSGEKVKLCWESDERRLVGELDNRFKAVEEALSQAIGLQTR